MLRAVEFKNQPRRQTGEIGNERPDTVLAPEFVADQTAVAQLLSRPRFGYTLSQWYSIRADDACDARHPTPPFFLSRLRERRDARQRAG